MERYEGKIVWITGGSGDIACATAERLLEEGATVILSSRSEERLGEECRKLEEKGYEMCIRDRWWVLRFICTLWLCGGPREQKKAIG